MTYLTRVSRFAWGVGFALGVSSGCGGNSVSDGGSSGAGAAPGAGTSSGGSPSEPGSSGMAAQVDAGSAGRVSVGGTSAGSDGSGGTPVDCEAPAESGNCEAAIPRWFNDASTGVCRPFTYGGCGGNANNFETLAACQKACAGGSPDYAACVTRDECVIASSRCGGCEVCDSEGVTAHDLIAYNKKYRDEVTSCGEQRRVCDECAEPPVFTGTRRFFIPDCVEGQCVVEDLRESPLTACEVAADCRLRNGIDCCEACNGHPTISIHKDVVFRKLICGDQPTSCLHCGPVYPPGSFSVCEGGHCRVVN